MTFAVSPRFEDSKLASGSLDDIIDVYEDQVVGWLLEPARMMVNNQHAGFAILSLALTYFEPLGQSLDGRPGKSDRQFIKGLCAVFPNAGAKATTAVLQELYDQLRCGMYHRGLTKGKVMVARSGQAAMFAITGTSGELREVKVDPWLLLEEIAAHHQTHIARLRNPAEGLLRANFHAWFQRRAA